MALNGPYKLMGDLNVRLIETAQQQNDFTHHLLRDLQAMQIMLDEGWFETEQMHIGAEQEICLVDPQCKPAPHAIAVLDRINSENYTTELAKFNVEVNLSPQPFKASCFSDMAAQLEAELSALDEALKGTQMEYLITGILPTLRKFDMGHDKITPLDRYYALMKAISKARGADQEIHIKGYDELNIRHDSAMLESCNTSFQVHLQVRPDEFVQKYNLAQLVAAPVMAISANSPMLFGKRLWHETRIALFQQSIDTRLASTHLRDRSPRVMFGNDWIRNSVLDLYKEDIARFKPMLMTTADDSLETLKQGITPKLRALMIHNSTVYRWNRACFGISPSGKPHLRIENRLLPAGPTTQDEMANAAFWLGLMNGMETHYPDFTSQMDFADVKSNFYNCAQTSLNAKIRWFADKKESVTKIIANELLPIAREGLEKNKVDAQDIDRYLGIIEARNEACQNGAAWMLRSYSHMTKDSSNEERVMAIASSLVRNQKSDQPVHEWPLAGLPERLNWHPSTMLVEEFMTKDLFTVQPQNILRLVADIMDWRHLRFIPVEDDQGKLIGLMSRRLITRHLVKNPEPDSTKTLVKDLMIENPITISPESTIFEAMNLMREHRIGCLPVVKKERLVGIVTEGNFLNITATLVKIINQKQA